MEMRKIADFHSISERRSSENTTDGRHVKDFHQFQSINEDFPNLWRIVVSWYWESDAKLKNSPKPCVCLLWKCIFDVPSRSPVITVTSGSISSLYSHYLAASVALAIPMQINVLNANQRQTTYVNVIGNFLLFFFCIHKKKWLCIMRWCVALSDKNPKLSPQII